MRSRLVIVFASWLFRYVAFSSIIVPVLPFPSHFSLVVSSNLNNRPVPTNPSVSNKHPNLNLSDLSNSLNKLLHLFRSGLHPVLLRKERVYQAVDLLHLLRSDQIRNNRDLLVLVDAVVNLLSRVA